MEVKVIHETGYEAALFGLGFSYGVTSGFSFEGFMKDKDTFRRVAKRASKLAGMGVGHDKFLRAISIIIDVNAPRYWWQEADQYKVNTTTLSESTMHTIENIPFTQEMFEPQDDGSPAVPIQIVEYLERLRQKYVANKSDITPWKQIISCLPQSFLQRRLLCCNYQNLANILQQRKGHKLTQWRFFCESIYRQVQHPELLTKGYSEGKGE